MKQGGIVQIAYQKHDRNSDAKRTNYSLHHDECSSAAAIKISNKAEQNSGQSQNK